MLTERAHFVLAPILHQQIQQEPIANSNTMQCNVTALAAAPLPVLHSAFFVQSFNVAQAGCVAKIGRAEVRYADEFLPERVVSLSKPNQAQARTCPLRGRADLASRKIP